MDSKKLGFVLWVLAPLIILLVVLNSFEIRESNYPIEPSSRIENIIASTAKITWKENNNGVTTGTIIGSRPSASTGAREYFLLTAEHALDSEYEYDDNYIFSVSVQIILNPFKVENPTEVADQAKIITRLPAFDLLVISFESDKILTHTEYGDFNQLDTKMHLGDKIYAIGCDLGRYPLIRTGVLGLKISNWLSDNSDDSVYFNHKMDCFSPSLDAWKGASGGGVYTQDGEYIGMIVATAIHGHLGVFHMPTAIKFSAIKRWLEMANVGYVLEVM